MFTQHKVHSDGETALCNTSILGCSWGGILHVAGHTHAPRYLATTPSFVQPRYLHGNEALRTKLSQVAWACTVVPTLLRPCPQLCQQLRSHCAWFGVGLVWGDNTEPGLWRVLQLGAACQHRTSSHPYWRLLTLLSLRMAAARWNTPSATLSPASRALPNGVLSFRSDYWTRV